GTAAAVRCRRSRRGRRRRRGPRPRARRRAPPAPGRRRRRRRRPGSPPPGGAAGYRDPFAREAVHSGSIVAGPYTRLMRRLPPLAALAVVVVLAGCGGGVETPYRAEGREGALGEGGFARGT